MYDVIIIGGGVIGCGILRELSFYRLKTLILEAASDVSTGASRANSGIVHAGYDCKPGTLKARFNAEGNAMYPALTAELNVPFEQTGSLVVAFSDGMDGIAKLHEYGIKNGVYTEIIGRERILELEPNISDEIEYALYAPTAGIVSPYKLTIAMADHGIINGAEIKTDSRVLSVSYDYKKGVYTVESESGTYQARYLINAAGTHSMEINRLAGTEIYPTEFRRGEYFVLDQTERNNIKRVIFPLPDKSGKGILVAPTADGNMLYGPTSIPTESPDDTAVTLEGLEQVRQGVRRTFKNVNFRKVIRVFAGLRSVSGDDFIIKKSEILPDYYMLLGICSPGLSSAPAIAAYVAKEVASEFSAVRKSEIKPPVKHKKFVNLSAEELDGLIKKDRRWGRLICRCEKVSEAEIVEAIHSPLPAKTVDAVKRRTRAGMGRCQGGFCSPRVIEILSRELNIPVTEVRLNEKGSEYALSKIKE